MSQYDIQISDLERIFRKQYKIIILCIVLSVCFCILFARLKVPLYSTVSTVKIDRNSMMGFSNESVMYGSWDNIETQTKVIKSFPVLLVTAKILNLIPDTVSESMHLGDEAVLSRLMSVGSKISTSISSGTNIIEIAATSSDPAEAKNIANAVAYAYKEYSINNKKLHATRTKEFIKSQLAKCQEDLASIEHEIRQFEEYQRIPSIKENTSRLIEEEGKVQALIEEIDNKISIITLDAGNLTKWLQNKEGGGEKAHDAANPPRKDMDSLLTRGNMEWISQVYDQDPGLVQLNNRLIQLQIQYDDQLSFYKTDHPTLRDIDGKIRNTIGQIVEKYRVKLNELNAKRIKLRDMKASIDRELKVLPGNEMEYARMQRRMNVAEKLNAELTSKLQEALIADAGVTDDVTIMSLATLPSSPVNKSVSKVAIVGLFLGIILGIIFAIVREMFDTSISTIKDVEKTMNLVVLAVIPHIIPSEPFARKKGGKQPGRTENAPQHAGSVLASHFNPKLPAAEAYRILRTNIEYILSNRKVKTILITSAAMQEGKSTTIANLAVVFAQQGKRVLILELNLRRPSLRHLFGYTPGMGVADILIEKTDWRSCVMSVVDMALGSFSMDDIFLTPGLDNLYILPHGHTPLNPTELISSGKMDALLDELKDYFDLILVDGPPLLPVADSMIISKKVDGVVLVYMVGKTPRNSLRLTKDRLSTVQANILGLVLNGIRPETTGTEYASYSFQTYAAAKESKQADPKRHRIPLKMYTGER